MQFTAAQIAALINGKTEGNPEVKVHNIAKIEEAGEGDLSFIANPKYEPYAYTTGASILLVSDDLVLEKEISPVLIRVANPYMAFSKLLNHYQKLTGEKQGRETPHFIHETAEVSEEVYIGAFAYIGKNAKVGKGSQIYPHTYIGEEVEVGNDTKIYSGVKIYPQCKIGNDCIIHAGTVIGSDGFGFAPKEDGTYQKVPQIGNVIIENDVEIGANTTIDSATLGSTIIRKGTKLDNLIQVGHNVEIGEYTVIAAQTGISGSTKLGKQCMIGGQVGFVGHISIADGTKINAQSGISKSIKETGQAWNGSPAFAYRDCLKSQVYFKRLPEMAEQIRALEKMIHSLKKE